MIIIPIFEEIFWFDHYCQQYVGQHEQSFGKHCCPYDCQLDLCKGYKFFLFGNKYQHKLQILVGI